VEACGASARRRRSKRSGIGLMERPRSRSVADPGRYIRTPDHLSVLVKAFLRRGKPRSELKPSVRLERAAEAHRRARGRAPAIAIVELTRH
jgi:hypothetical protein